MPFLPVVTEDVGFAVQAEVSQTPDNDYMVDLIKRLQNENPCVINFISQLSIYSKDPLGASACGLLVYRLLESQAEADQMNRAMR